MIQRLARGEASVTELVDHVGLSQPLVSWHVGKLRDAHLVATNRIGRETVCRLRADVFADFVARERAILGLDWAHGPQPERPRNAPVPRTIQPEEAVS
jgi:ArsR family transcriptional regulator